LAALREHWGHPTREGTAVNEFDRSRRHFVATLAVLPALARAATAEGAALLLAQ
jgi:hypothetical protein